MHPLLRAAADRQLGVFTAADARRAGYGHDEIRHLRGSGRWVALRRGIYMAADDLARVTGPRRRHLVDCLAVLLELGRPEAAVSSVSAARVWGLPVRRDLDRTVRLTHPTAGRRGRGFRMAQASLTAADVTTKGPVRVTTAARTLVDCAREWELDDAVVAMDAALLAEWTSPSELRRAVVAARGWPGVRRAERAASLADGRADSPLETRGRLRLVGAALPPTDLQVEIRTGGRRVGVVDAWFEEAAVAVEFDGRVKYSDPWRGRTPQQVLWDEKRREDELRALDIRIVRIAEADVHLPAWHRIEARLRRILATPGRTARRFSATPRTSGRRRAG
jgi:predicted transcriptional regulator of viral defense system